jgi:hypothetical protein
MADSATWTAVTDKKPPTGETVSVYDAFHVGLSSGRWNGEEFEVDDAGGRGTFVTHWRDETPPSGSPDPKDVHRVCKESF